MCILTNLHLVPAFTFVNFLAAVLQAFVQEVTGLKVVQGNRIKVIIEERDDHIKTLTCSKEIVLSTRVEAFDTFKTAMLAVIGTENFTMVS